ncbi:asparagine synthase (glutamine-hydrolyzing) [Methylomonas methanica]|uniref:asparagine synthase (glutamine-hydrolyzing) n=1 Tax=Methylomonas methanica (strain DSM 25384 / MC09) TaxID=857087 RepID=F9ZW42_METMM|nr:asparagine synthase (glutamine-hydrolyzing) [Methylomonas methanica]AEG02013.1 asparagine synthase (glutamine-hydrolyzing) [Methylomonas methanica MC09]
MCGLIALRAHSALPDLSRIGRAALDTLSHRGPDDTDWLETDDAHPPTFLGHRRLSILDLSSAGRQPMTCPVTGNSLVFNGEIYNFVELRHELQLAGCTFRTDTDTEVVLHAWRIWGEAAFARFNGMWALVLLERASGSLICCRDRLGVKPLYYARDNNGDRQLTILASEIRAIATVLGAYPPPEPKTVFDFLMTGVSDHSRLTFYQGIRSVPPGWIIRLDCHGDLHSKPYHQWPETAPDNRLDPEHLRELISDAVSVRLRSDAPSVTLLSGGLDSSIVTALAAKACRTESRSCHAGAYSYGYRHGSAVEHDETARAAAFIAEHLPGTRHFTHLADALPTEAELMQLTRIQEEPIATPSVLAGYRIFRGIRDDGFKVVLSGEGADEVFGGYTARYMSLLARDGIFAGRLLPAARLWRNGVVTPGQLSNQLVWGLPPNVVRGLLRRTRPSALVMSPALWNAMAPEFSALYQDRRVDLEQRLRRDVTATNLPMILRWTDRNSMHFGIEVRSPYLDWRVVSAALAAPISERMGDNHGKLALRRAFSGQLPDDVVWRRKTHGFGNAEQFQVNNIRFEALWETLPAWAGDWLSLPDLRRELSRSGNHTTLWWAVSLALWLAAIYGEGSGKAAR